MNEFVVGMTEANLRMLARNVESMRDVQGAEADEVRRQYTDICSDWERLKARMQPPPVAGQ